MPQRDDAWLRNQQQRFMRPDAISYLRPDAARFLIPGTNPAAIYPALARKWAGQPLIPKDDDDGGQYTFGKRDDDRSSDGRVRVYITRPAETSDELDAVDGDADNSDADDSNDDNFLSGLQLAGDLPDGLGTPGDDPPRILENKPGHSSQRNAVLRRVAEWLGPRVGGLAGEILPA